MNQNKPDILELRVVELETFETEYSINIRVLQKEDKEIEHLETITKNGKLFLKFKVLRSSRLRSSILQDKLSEIGKIKTFEKEVNMNVDKKRFWLGEIESIDSRIMNESVPISMNYFSAR